MDQRQDNSTLEKSVKQVMQGLPPPIRDYLAKESYTLAAKKLSSAFNFRIDQSGILERELMLLLMGVETPEEFTTSLKEDARLTDDTVRSLMREINAQVFVPLQEEMRKGFERFAPQAPRREIPGVKPEPRPGESHFRLENKIPPPTPQPMPAVRPVLSTVSQPMNPAPSIRPGLREALAAATKAPVAPDANRLLEDHEEPHIEFKKESIVAPVRLAPPSTPLTPPLSRPAPVPPRPQALAPQNLPGTVPPHVIPPGGRAIITPPRPGIITPPPPPAGVPPMAAAPSPAPQTRVSPAPPITKAYAVDPYREPFNDHQA